MNIVSVLFISLLSIMVLVQLWLSYRQSRYVFTHREQVPEAFSGQISLAAHQKAADYTLAKSRVARPEIIVAAVITFLWTLGGGLASLSSFWYEQAWSPLATGVGLIISFLLISSVLELPFSWYRTFQLEAEYGFNHSTGKLFFSDTLKQLCLMLLLGTPLIWGALWLMQSAGELWWVYLWGAWMALIIIMMWAYPAFIAPLFNQFTPLEDEALKQRVDDLLQRCGFKSNGIFVMDGSRRSGHGNAYFTGLGNNKRIVFFDTLLNSLQPEQIEAVLAHELGHFKHRHILKNMMMMAMISLASLAILGWIIDESTFYHGLGVTTETDAVALLLFMLVTPILGFFIQPLMAQLSRRYEYEADHYAAKMVNGTVLIDALVTLYQENASTLTPDPLVSAIYDSHPPAMLRIAELQRHVVAN